MPKIFVSYAREEAQKIYRILARLEQHGLKFWVDTRDIRSGKDWAEEISNAILRCNKLLLFMSRLSMASNNTSKEVKIASAHGKEIILLRLDDADIPPRLKYALQDIQWTDYSSRKWKREIVTALGGDLTIPRKTKEESKPAESSVKTRPTRKKQAKTARVATPSRSAASGDRTESQERRPRPGIVSTSILRRKVEQSRYDTLTEAPVADQLAIFSQTLSGLEYYLDTTELFKLTDTALTLILNDIFVMIRGVGELKELVRFSPVESLQGALEELRLARDAIQVALRMFSADGQISASQTRRFLAEMRSLRSHIEKAILHLKPRATTPAKLFDDDVDDP